MPIQDVATHAIAQNYHNVLPLLAADLLCERIGLGGSYPTSGGKTATEGKTVGQIREVGMSYT
jgi:hypothetical protein